MTTPKAEAAPGSARAGGRAAPPILGTGFRVFFLLGAVAAVGLVPAWLYLFDAGREELGLFPPLEWHRHEMLFGFTGAVIAGFLLTAVPNWCGTRHKRGLPIAALAALWAAGRVAILVPGRLPWGAASMIDLAFLPALGAVLAPDLFRARKPRNLGFLAVLAALAGSNLVLHLDALEVAEGGSYRATQAALDLVALLMLVIGGRVIPYFTRKKLGVAITEPPALWVGTHLGASAVIAGDALAAPGPVRAAACLATAGFAAARLRRWQAPGTWRTPLLWVLHLGFGWVLLGLVAKAVAAVVPGYHPRLSAHFFTVGGIGTLTIGMMTRVTLGHTGRPIVAPRLAVASFVLMTGAAGIRAVLPVLWPAWYPASLKVSGALWTAAFLLYIWVSAPMLLGPRPDGRAS